MRRANLFLFAAFAFILLLAPDAWARIEQTLSHRAAASLAPVIVEADLVSRVGPHGGLAGSDPEKPSDLEFKITRVLRGPVKAGEALKYEWRWDYYLEPDEREPRPKLQKALLFLRPHTERKDVFSRVELHYLDERGRVLTPIQIWNPGGRCLMPHKNVTWEQFMRRADAEVSATGAVLALREVRDPAQRNQALFRWIEQHKAEFGQDRDEDNGWYPLEGMIYEWILETQIPEDCWRASSLRVELSGYCWFSDSGYAFGTPDGRAFLLRIVLDSKRDPHERARALSNFSRGLAIEPYKGKGIPATAEECKELLKALRPLLADQDADVAKYTESAIKTIEWYEVRYFSR